MDNVKTWILFQTNHPPTASKNFDAQLLVTYWSNGPASLLIGSQDCEWPSPKSSTPEKKSKF